MERLHIHNSLSRKKEEFEPLNPPFVGMYVCGPTVYGPPHLGHARSALSFDIVFRYLKYLGYRVRYVRNITDVGHLVDDADEGEDKIAKKARVEQLEPMEVAQLYTNIYHEFMGMLNLLNPSIEPHASGHIPEQIEYVERILKNGYAYEKNGSVYFDVRAYDKEFGYGVLSGRNLEEMETGTRDLDSQDEKNFSGDFALWKKASPEHIMRWDSPWSEGFPGWHIECTVMSTKYLGQKYDIHGGGMDLVFPHHEAEICQTNGALGDVHSHDLNEAKYWMHNNMITLDGQKMGKSLGNAISLEEFFTGNHKLLEQAYTPMTIRFFMLQAHYRSTLDFSNAALQASEKALDRLSDAYTRLNEIEDRAEGEIDEKVEEMFSNFKATCEGYMNDDFNTAKVIAQMFDVTGVINELYNKKAMKLPLKSATFAEFKESFNTFFTDILGLQASGGGGTADGKMSDVMELLISMRQQARADKNFELSDQIRDRLAEVGIQLKDTPEGTDWMIEE